MVMTYREFHETRIDWILESLKEEGNMLTEAREKYMDWPKNPFGQEPAWQEIESAWQRGEYDVVKKGMEQNWDSVEKYTKEGLEQFNALVKRIGGRILRTAEFMSQTKKKEAAIGKATGRGPKSTNPLELGDLVRGAILVNDQNELIELVRDFKRKADVIQYEEKAQGEDPTYGYFGSHHFDIRLPNGMIAELQIMTKRLWKQKEVAHQIYTATREKIDPATGKKVVPRDAAITSKMIFKVGNKPKGFAGIPAIRRAKGI